MSDQNSVSAAGRGPHELSRVAQTLTERARRVCDERGVTQQELAKRAVLSGAALSKLLRGLTEPTAATVERLHAALDEFEQTRPLLAAAGRRPGAGARSSQERTEFARRGGLAVTSSPKCHVFTDEERRRGGVRGGQAVSGDRDRMSALGRKGVTRRWEKYRAARGLARNEVDPSSSPAKP